jgi:acyl carrier protein
VSRRALSPKLAEQLARREAILARARAMLVEKLHLRHAPDAIDPDVPLFGSGLGLDSIDAIELIVCVEQEFGLKLREGRSLRARLRTLNTLVDEILKHEAATTGGGDVAA